jgi:hypothetical protein
MIRPLAALALAALTLTPAIAQETPAAPAPANNVTIDPLAGPDKPNKQVDLLTGFYATVATIEICAVTIDPGIKAGMDADQRRLETSLGLDPARAAEAYAKVKADVEKTAPDCADGSPDRIGVDALTAIYAAQAAASPNGGVAPAATPAPTDAPAPAAPTAQ